MKCSFCGQEMNEDNNFCPYCGKEQVIVVNAKEVEPEATQVQSTVQSASNPQEISSKYGFDGALKATIFGVCSFVSFLFSLFLTILAPALGVMLSIAGVIFAVFGIVKGVRGIKDFIYAKNTANVKPVATLVLGIVGVASAACAILYGFCFVFIMLIELMLYI